MYRSKLTYLKAISPRCYVLTALVFALLLSPAAQAADTFGRSRNQLKSHAAPARHPFVATSPDRRPCPGA